MSADAALVETSLPQDLPRRTWKQWWRQAPAWQRMLVWAGAVLAVLHVLVCVRLLIGQFESREIRILRQRNIFFRYFWEQTPERFVGEHWLIAGLFGKSSRSVCDLRLGSEATDADLALIGKQFPELRNLDLEDGSFHADSLVALRNCPNLTTLDLARTAVTSESLEALVDCRELFLLMLQDTDIDDVGIEFLCKLPKLRAIDLRGTLITDASLPLLAQLPNLNSVAVHHTDITPPTTGNPRPKGMHGDRWEGGAPTSRAPRRIAAAVRWSDGERSGRYSGRYVIRIRREIPATAFSERMEAGEGLTREQLAWDIEAIPRGWGDCLLDLKLGEFASETCRLPMDGDLPWLSVIDFQMPVTKAEASSSPERGASAP